MMLKDIFTRTLGFRRMRSTEDIQRAIMTFLYGHGEATPVCIMTHMFPEEEKANILPEVLQAAQILVNRRELTAWQDDARVDPIYSGEKTVLRLAR